MKAFMYYLAMVLGAPLALLFFRMKVSYEGGERFPLPEGAILIAGHKSPFDAIAIAYLFFFRRLYFLAADWYRGFLRIFRPLMRMTGAIFVDLKGEVYSFLPECKALLGKGKSILVFPEGDYARTKSLFELGPFKTGYLLIARESGAPIIPIVSDFSYGSFRRLHLRIGRPIYVPQEEGRPITREEVSSWNEEVRERCLSLLHELRREKAEAIKFRYEYREPRKGEVLRVKAGPYHHYGVFLDEGRVVEFGRAYNPPGEKIDVHLATLLSFAGGMIPEVRVPRNPFRKRRPEDVEAYAREVLRQEGYSLEANNCLDLVNRLTLKI